MNYANCLYDEPPLLVFPTLAAKIGLHEAIILQQLHYWLLRSKNEADGRKWVYNSYPQWQEQFPFWSVPTIQRAFLSLEKRAIVISEKFNRKDWDQRKWYSIDYKVLNDVFNGGDAQTSVCAHPVRMSL